MKKLFCLALVLVLSLSAFATAFAAPFYLEEAGVTIEVPDGMTGQDITDETAYMLGITVDDNDALRYAYTLSYIEEFEGKYLEELTDEECEQIGMGIVASIENPQFAEADADGYKLLVVANGEGTQLHYFSLLNGWLCDVAAGKGDGVALTDEEIATAAQLLTSIQFDDSTEEATEAAE